MTVSLAARLRVATQDLHAAVERAGAMGSLLKGRLSRAGYLALLAVKTVRGLTGRKLALAAVGIFLLSLLVFLSV